VGPPATAKSLFLMELGRLGATYSATGSRVTAAGLTDAFFNYQPRVLLLDEIDKVSLDATAVLLSAMETGDVLITKYKRTDNSSLTLLFLLPAILTETSPGTTLSLRSQTLLLILLLRRLYCYMQGIFIQIRGCFRRYGGVYWPTDLELLDKDVRTARGIARQVRNPYFPM